MPSLIDLSHVHYILYIDNFNWVIIIGDHSEIEYLLQMNLSFVTKMLIGVSPMTLMQMRMMCEQDEEIRVVNLKKEIRKEQRVEDRTSKLRIEDRADYRGYVKAERVYDWTLGTGELWRKLRQMLLSRCHKKN